MVLVHFLFNPNIACSATLLRIPIGDYGRIKDESYVRILGSRLDKNTLVSEGKKHFNTNITNTELCYRLKAIVSRGRFSEDDIQEDIITLSLFYYYYKFYSVYIGRRVC